jgi:large subunit ribosomal protein L9e
VQLFNSFSFIVTIDVKARKVTVKGPRGALTKDFSHVDVELVPSKETLKVQVWFGIRKHNACIRTVATHIQNMIKGVTKVSFEVLAYYGANFCS